MSLHEFNLVSGACGLVLLVSGALAQSQSSNRLTGPAPRNVPPARQGGDVCEQAVQIPLEFPFYATGTTESYNDDYDEVCTFNTPGSPDVVYFISLVGTGNDRCITIDLCTSEYDTKVYVYRDICGPFQSGVFVACNDDACGDNGWRSRIENLTLTAGGIFYIVIDGYGGDSGTYHLYIDECVPSPECPQLGEQLFDQPAHTPASDWSADTSEQDVNDSVPMRYERTNNDPVISDPINSLHWWGLFGHFVGATWETCTESDPQFEITFWEDNETLPPDTIICGPYVVTPEITPTALEFDGFTLYEFGITGLFPQCLLPEGNCWVSIVGLGDTNCWFLWMSSSGYDDTSYYNNDGAWQERDHDLSLCMGSVVVLAGACCNDATGVCTDDVLNLDCVGPDERFASGTLCANLVPPCETSVGACCREDAECQIVSESVCRYSPGDMNCDASVNFDDINPFVTALVSESDYVADWPDCNFLNGDMDANLVVNFDDINLFVERLVQGGAAQEPGLWLGAGSTCDMCPCIVPTPPDASEEGEPDCGDEYVDVVNGGCDSSPPVFGQVACGETIHGTSGTFSYQSETRADEDWFAIELAESMTLTVSLLAEFDGVVGLGEQYWPGESGCENLSGYLNPDADNTPCETTSFVTDCLPAGTYYLVVKPAQGAGAAPCGADYTLTVECEPCTLTGACCDGEGGCTVTDEDGCTAGGGVYIGDNIECYDGVCDPCPDEIACPDGGIPEGEPDCYPGYVDTTNSGCGGDPVVFGTMQCGTVTCGTSGIYHEDGGWLARDTDWYEFSLTQPATVTVEVQANLPIQVMIVTGPCENLEVVAFTNATTGCGRVTAECPAGTHSVWIGSAAWDPLHYPCGDSVYVATLTCEPGS